MRPQMIAAMMILLLTSCAPAAAPATATLSPATPSPDTAETVSAPCPVTLPNVTTPTLPEPYDTFTLANADQTLYTIPWPDGVVTFDPSGAGFVEEDGSLAMKWPWYRVTPGKIEVTGQRIDADAPPLRFEANDGYGDSGFQPMYLIFPTEGCWEVTGSVADSTLTFVTLVVNNRE